MKIDKRKVVDGNVQLHVQFATAMVKLAVYMMAVSMKEIPAWYSNQQIKLGQQGSHLEGLQEESTNDHYRPTSTTIAKGEHDAPIPCWYWRWEDCLKTIG